MKRKYAVVDIETTGNNIDSDEMIQIGIAIVQDKQIIKTFDSFISCNQQIPAFIQSLTKIDEAHLLNAPEFSEIAPDIYALLEDCVFVAHNVQFDLRFLQKYFSRMHMDYQPNYIIDTVDWFKIVYPSLERYQLKSIADELNINLDLAHRAIDDAVATAEVLIASINKVSVYPTDTLKRLYKYAKIMRYNMEELIFEILLEYSTENHFEYQSGLYYYKNQQSFDTLPPIHQSFDQFFENTIMKLGFTFREKQFELSQRIYNQLMQQNTMTIEADLGSGKTVSYLIALIYYLSNQQTSVLLSTSTIFLQKQIINDDLKQIEAALQIQVPVQFIKSKRHYLSLQFINEILNDEKENHDILLLKMQLLTFILEPHGGDIDRLNLNGGRKIYFDLMYALYDYNRDADYIYNDISNTPHIGITNHAHLLSRRKNDIFKSYNHLIVDEAHQLLDYALNNAYDTFNYQNIKYIIGQTIKSLPDNKVQSLNDIHNSEYEMTLLTQKIDDLFDHLSLYYEGKYVIKVTIEENSHIYALFKEINNILTQLQNGQQDDVVKSKLAMLHQYFLSVWIQIKVYKELYIQMKNHNKASMSLISKSITINDLLANRIFNKFSSKIFLSGTMQTLSFLDQFNPEAEHFYKYENTFSKYKATLFVPNDVPQFNYQQTEQYIESCMQYIHYYLENISSKVLILMNSYAQIDLLRSYLIELFDPSLIISQTSDVNTVKLNEQFNLLDKGVFLATQTFYEGVDFKYDGFKTVMIISLPFMHPDDLNIMLMRDEVNDVFMDYQLPSAVNKLHQATGRLIRNENDRGILICFDRRILEGKFSSHFSHILKSFNVQSANINKFTEVIDEINQKI